MYITLGLFATTAYCQTGLESLYAESRSDTGSTEKEFTQPKDVQYAPRFLQDNSGLYAETKSDEGETEKTLEDPRDPVYEDGENGGNGGKNRDDKKDSAVKVVAGFASFATVLYSMC